jgi:hypothetical protein
VTRKSVIKIAQNYRKNVFCELPVNRQKRKNFTTTNSVTIQMQKKHFSLSCLVLSEQILLKLNSLNNYLIYKEAVFLKDTKKHFDGVEAKTWYHQTFFCILYLTKIKILIFFFRFPSQPINIVLNR